MISQARFGTLAVFMTGLASIGAPARLQAVDVIHADDVIVEGSLCVSDDNACADGESFPSNADIKIKDALPRLLFEDSSSSTSPDRHYRIAVGGSGISGAEYFAIEDAGSSGNGATQVFRIDGAAPANALRVDSSGDVGLGTATPAQHLHVADGNTPTLRLDQDGSGAFAAQVWDIMANEGSFRVRDVTGNQTPFAIQSDAPTNSLYIKDTGQVGVGTSNPSLDAGNGIHISAAENQFAFLGAGVDPAGGGSCAFNIGYGGGAAPGTVFITTRPCGGGEMTRFFVGNTERASADTVGFQVFGSLRVNGTGVNVPDYVFRPGCAIESIEQHADSMWRESHLPALGPAAADGGFEVAKTTLGMLEELEKAHIYIEQLHEEAKQKDERTAALEKGSAELAARVERLEALVAAAIGGER